MLVTAGRDVACASYRQVMDSHRRPPSQTQHGRGPVQGTLPLDGDEPIPFRLTARARRAVAPDTLPPLEVVDPADDTLRARARALRRAGVDAADVAAELRVASHVVAAWTADVAPVASAQRRLRARPSLPGHAVAPDPDPHRRRGADEAVANLRVPDFTAGLGLLLGVADVGPHAVVVRCPDLDTATLLGAWLGRWLAPPPGRVRLLVRVAPQVAADRARHGWAEALRLPLERVTATPWPQAPNADAVEASLRIADPAVASRIAGWRDALLALLAAGPSDGVPATAGDAGA